MHVNNGNTVSSYILLESNVVEIASYKGVTNNKPFTSTITKAVINNLL